MLKSKPIKSISRTIKTILVVFVCFTLCSCGTNNGSSEIESNETGSSNDFDIFFFDGQTTASLICAKINNCRGNGTNRRKYKELWKQESDASVQEYNTLLSQSEQVEFAEIEKAWEENMIRDVQNDRKILTENNVPLGSSY